jgi:hypothetical protein
MAGIEQSVAELEIVVKQNMEMAEAMKEALVSMIPESSQSDVAE